MTFSEYRVSSYSGMRSRAFYIHSFLNFATSSFLMESGESMYLRNLNVLTSTYLISCWDQTWLY